MIDLYTIGFTNKPAEKFFKLLTDSNVVTLVDTRLNNVSQLSGFAKGQDLAFFAKQIGNMKYQHKVDLAPTKDLLEKYRKKEMKWAQYEVEYLNILDIRKIGDKVDIEKLHKGCLLCSEHTPEKCHRRLLAEYLQARFTGIKIHHLF